MSRLADMVRALAQANTFGGTFRVGGMILAIALCIGCTHVSMPLGEPLERTFTSPLTHTPETAPRLVIETGGHQAIIRKLLFTPNGQELISVSDDKSIRIWTVSADGRRGVLARTLRGQIGDGDAGALYAAALSPAQRPGPPQWLAVGGLLAGSAADRYAIRLHDYASGEIVALLYGHQEVVNALAFAPTGDWLASAGKDNTLRLWNLTALQGSRLTREPLVLTGHTDAIYDLAWSPAGDRLASASYDHTVGLWNTAAVAQGKASLVARLHGHAQTVRTVAWHPEGTILASGGKDQTIRLWRAHDGRAEGIFARPQNEVAGLAFAPDGRSILAGRAGGQDVPQRVTLYSYPNGTVQQVLTGHDNVVLATAFHPNGQWIASGGGNAKATLLWHAQTGEVLSRLEGIGQTIWAVGFAPDGHAISWGQTFRYTTDNDRGPLEHQFDLTRLVRLPGPVPTPVRAQAQVEEFTLATERGGPLGYMYRLHVQRRGKRLSTIERGASDGYQHTAYTFTPDRHSVLSGGFNGVLTLYGLDGTPRLRLRGHTGEIKAVAVSADGHWALSGAADQTLKLWSLAALPASGTAEVAPTLSLFPATNGEWVAWRPEGFFAASPRGSHLIGYSINQGLDKLAQYVTIDQLYERFYRPDLLHTQLYGDPEQLWHQDGAQTNAVTTLAAGLPPRVTFASPVTDTTVAHREVDVQILLTDQGGGIGKVIWKIDGVTTAVDTSPSRDASRFSTTAGAVTLTKRLALTPGKNTLEVVAYNRQNDVTSTPTVLSVTFAEAPPLSPFAAAPSISRPPVTPSSSPGPLPPSMPSVTASLPPPSDPSASPITAVPEAPPVPSPDTANRPTAPVVVSSESPPPSLPILHVFVIGVNRYRDKSLELKYAVQDAQALVTTLRSVAAPLFRDITFTSLLDEQVILTSLEATFARIATQAKPQDVFVLYIAGHGVTRDSRYYFIPQDFWYRNDEAIRSDAITQDHWQRWLASIPARKSLLLIDTCESGSFPKSLALLRGMAEKTAIAKLTRATGRATIVAATAEQQAVEGYQGHGVFTYVLLQALQRADTSHGNRDGMTSIFELASYVDDQVPIITRQTFNLEQLPQVHMVGSDFPLGIVQSRR